MSDVTPSSAREVNLAILTLYKPIAAKRQRLITSIRVNSAIGLAAREDRPVDLTVALDCSASMKGEKIAAAVATMRALVDQLGPADRLALVAFSTAAEVLFEPCLMTAQAKSIVHSALSGIGADGATDLLGALLLSLTLARNETTQNPRHVLVLSDGAPTVSVTDDAQISRLTEGALGSSTLSTFGYGDDVRSELLGQLADLGKGNYHFVAGTEAPVEAFASELGRQRTLVAVEVTLRLAAGDGIAIGMLPAFSRKLNSSAQLVELALPPLLACDARTLVVGLDVGEEALNLQGTSPWLTAQLQYRSMTDAAFKQVKATLIPLLAKDEGPLVQEVAQAFIVQRTAELIRTAVGGSLSDTRTQHQALEKLAEHAGLADDAQVKNALAMLRHIFAELHQERTRRTAVAKASSLARGVYHREVTAIRSMAGYSRPASARYAERMRHSMANPSTADSSSEPPKKPGGDEPS